MSRPGQSGPSEAGSAEAGASARLNELLRGAGLASLDAETGHRFEQYLALILHWNARTNLTSVRDPDGILGRHFVECIACARALPAGIRTLLDFGSGAGFPGLPIALCRSEVGVTLAESQGKKAAFLQEAVRSLGVPVSVYGGRAERLGALFDCVTLRAVDHMPEAVAAAIALVRPGGWLALMTTTPQVSGLQTAAGGEFLWESPRDLPGSEKRILAVGSRQR